MSQKKQIEILNSFRNSLINILIATSVAEEGLDIPNTDLVIFFEPIASEIRTIQRRGRTGRNNIGKVIIMITKNTCEENYYWSSIQKEKKMKTIIKSFVQQQNIILSNEDTKKKNEITTNDYLVNDINKITKNILEIIVDDRELRSNVCSYLEQSNIKITVKKLNVGDYIVSNNIAVERKTISDFIYSLIKNDNNLFQQLINLSKNYLNSFLILEGNLNDLKKYSIHPNAIIGTILSISLDLNIHIIYSENEKQTSLYLIKMIEKEQIEKKNTINIKGKKIAKNKKEQKEYILSSIPGLGQKTAMLLLENFGSIINIFQANEEELIKIKGIGKKTINNLKEIIFENYNNY